MKSLPSVLVMAAICISAMATAAPVGVPRHGYVIYQGTYDGDVTSQSRNASKVSELSGAITLQAKFDGEAIDAMFKTTGLMRSARVTGLRTGDVCKLFFRDGRVMEGRCDSGSFEGKIYSPDGAKKQTDIAFSTRSTKVVDDDDKRKAAAESKVRRAEAASAAAQTRKKEQDDELVRQEEILKSLPPAKK